MMARVFFITLLVLISSCEYCSEYKEPYVIYRANHFNTEDIPKVEKFIREVAKQWELEIVEKSRDLLKIHNNGENAFNIFLTDKNDRNNWVLVIDNFGEYLSWDVYDMDVMPFTDLQKLTSQVKEILEQRFGLEFCEIDAVTSLCKSTQEH